MAGSDTTARRTIRNIFTWSQNLGPDSLRARANWREPWPAVVGQKGLLSWTDDGRGSPWLSEALRPFTARLRPQRGPGDPRLTLAPTALSLTLEVPGECQCEAERDREQPVGCVVYN
jgi:hypothetical protein